MMKRVYSCELCRDEMPAIELYGLHFVNLKDFEIMHAASTDGVHVCARCMDQIRTKPLPPVGVAVVRKAKI